MSKHILRLVVTKRDDVARSELAACAQTDGGRECLENLRDTTLKQGIDSFRGDLPTNDFQWNWLKALLTVDKEIRRALGEEVEP